jgi:hypothetical protein
MFMQVRAISVSGSIPGTSRLVRRLGSLPHWLASD